MTAPTETWVLCGGATHPSAPADALCLSVGDASGSMTVDIAGVSRTLTGRLSAEFTDLIRIAAFVLGADGAVSRGTLVGSYNLLKLLTIIGMASRQPNRYGFVGMQSHPEVPRCRFQNATFAEAVHC
jgi:hypothetical protein